MPRQFSKCRITVLKRMTNDDLVAEYLEVGRTDGFGACEQFADGQEFIVEHPYVMPEDFCAWAWADIRRDILTVAAGGDLPSMKQRGTVISGCTDWFRPVLFKLERIEE